jgi:hypothetical protein
MIRATAVIFILVTWSSMALAQSKGAQAEVLFRQGRSLMTAGKVAEACTAFDESQKLEPAVTTLLNLAACREKLGQVATAWGLFLDAVRQTRSAGDAATQQLHDIAEARARKLEPRVSKLTINVPQRSQVDGLEIMRGAEPVNAGLWNRALPIDGGTYTITARAPGASHWSTEVTVAPERDTKTIEIPDLRNLPRDLEKPTSSSHVDEGEREGERPPPRAPSKAVPLALGAGALVLLGGGLGLELWAESNYDAAKSEMMSQSRRDSLYDSAATKRYVAQGLVVTGLAAGGIAVWLYLRNGERGAPTSASVQVVPTAGGLAVAGWF